MVKPLVTYNKTQLFFLIDRAHDSLTREQIILSFCLDEHSIIQIDYLKGKPLHEVNIA